MGNARMKTRFRSEGRIGNVQMHERRGFAGERTIGRERLGRMASSIVTGLLMASTVTSLHMA
jgi:hypothetical protein